MKKYLIVVTALIITSCSNLDKTNISSITDYFENTCKNNEVNKLSKLLNIEQDSLKKHPSFYAISEFKGFLIKENPTIIKEEIGSQKKYGRKNFKRFYELGTDYYQLDITYNRGDDNLILIEGINFNNLNRSCEFEKENPFCPYNKVLIGKFWMAKTTDYNLSAAEVEIKNNLGFDINYIKFRVELTRWEDSPNENGIIENKVFYSQTIESHEKIYSGDMIRVKIPNISKLHTNFKLNENNFQYNNRLIEVKPNPNSYWCEKLEELKLYKGQ